MCRSFVLPSLADSFALVHVEATACGVPVITTPNCGSVGGDCVDAFILPISDASALADRIQQLFQDRLLRGQMKFAACQRAREFFGDRLLSALRVA